MNALFDTLNTTTGDQAFTGLVGDIGGTNARFAIATRTPSGTTLEHFVTMECSNHPGLSSALKAYFQEIGDRPALDYAVLAMAGPVFDGAIKLTNLDWLVHESDLAACAGTNRARLINDYAALAYALPQLKAEDTKTIGHLQHGQGQVWAVMGAGTGFGASVLLGGANGPYCLSTESGHMSFAPVNDFEVEILRFLRKKYGRVTIEMLLSGPGLVNIYQALCFVRGEKALEMTPAQITNLDGPDNQGCRHTVETFLDVMASVCGDLALAHGATAGMFIAGGIAPRLIRFIDEGRFRARMEAKAPMTEFAASVPSRIITYAYAALVGAAHALSDHELASN